MLAGVEFQRKLERAAYGLGGGKVPVQLFGDFCRNVPSNHAWERWSPASRDNMNCANVTDDFPGRSYPSALEEGIHGCEKL